MYHDTIHLIHIYILPEFFFIFPHPQKIPPESTKTQAQLRGICVISTAAYGLKEANFLEATAERGGGPNNANTAQKSNELIPIIAIF